MIYTCMKKRKTIRTLTQMREREKETEEEEKEREREDGRDPWIGVGGSGSDPDEFFRRFPGDFLFFPVVTSGAVGRSLQTIRSKIFTASQPASRPTTRSPLLRHGPPRGRGEGDREGDPDARNGRGLLAETHKPTPSALHNLLEPRPRKIFYAVPTFISDRDFIFISAFGLIRDRVIRGWGRGYLRPPFPSVVSFRLVSFSSSFSLLFLPLFFPSFFSSSFIAYIDTIDT